MADDAARTILRSAAPGQFDAVAENLQKLFGKQALSGSTSQWLTDVQDEMRKFQCIGIQQMVDLKQYPLAEPLLVLLKQYQKDTFGTKSGVTAKVVMETGSSSQNNGQKQQQLVVHTYAEKIDTPNQHSGCWRATWTIDKVSGNNDTGEIYGQVLVHSYAHEEGNVQLKITKDFPSVKVSKVTTNNGGQTTTTLEQAMVQQIIQWEVEILDILESLNESVTAEELRTIRRVLPITKTKMKWDVVAHRSVKTLRKTAPETRSKVKYTS